MRIVEIRECAIPLKSSLRNSSFDFVAVITDVVREGKPVAGFAFNSTGRYACGAAMRARFIPDSDMVHARSRAFPINFITAFRG
jgi:D(-)-tartrate dehydratase